MQYSYVLVTEVLGNTVAMNEMLVCILISNAIIKTNYKLQGIAELSKVSFVSVIYSILCPCIL